MGFFKHISSLVGFMGLPREQRQVVFYSEGPGYWAHLGHLMQCFLDSSDTPVCFFSSSEDDPGLSIEHPNLKTFLVDESWVRDWLFANIDTDLLVMTTPDLHQYQLKRSRHDVHYVYVQHSLVSLHMAYRPGAYDHFDTIFCAGPHHVAEAKALQARGNTQIKNIVEHGYERLDSILANGNAEQGGAQVDRAPHVLVAPSWGPTGIIERLGDAPITALLEAGCEVTLRPHPQTRRLSANVIEEILAMHRDDPKFHYDNDVSSTAALQSSDVMLSDWSGAALDYAFGFGKPVLFVDTPRKVNNPDYEDLGIEPFESSVRTEIGEVIAEDKLNTLGEVVERLAAKSAACMRELTAKHVFNAGSSAAVGAAALEAILQDHVASKSKQ